MFVLWIGVVCVLLKWLEVGPFAELDWLYVLAPLAVAFLWFEVFEKMLGKDKRKSDEIDSEKRRKERIKEQFATKGPKARRADS
jgi:small Trp-rich protein